MGQNVLAGTVDVKSVDMVGADGADRIGWERGFGCMHWGLVSCQVVGHRKEEGVMSPGSQSQDTSYTKHLGWHLEFESRV